MQRWPDQLDFRAVRGPVTGGLTMLEQLAV